MTVTEVEKKYFLFVAENGIILDAFTNTRSSEVKWSEVAGSGETNIITTQCETYTTVNPGHEYMKHLNTQQHNHKGPSMTSLSPSVLLM